jgi:putative peptidoglycan lipid II flippase
MVPIAGLVAVWSAVMHARSRFWAVSLVPAATPVVIALALVVGPARVESLAMGTLVGLVLEAVLLAVLVARAGFLVRPRLRWRDPGLQEVLRQYGPLVLGAVLLGLTPVCDRAIVATAGEGAVATLGYASRVVDALVGLGVTAIGTATLPHAARSVALGRRVELRRTLGRLVAVLLAVAVPLALAIAWWSRTIVAALFERGAFTAADTAAVADIQAVLAVQIPVYLVGIVAARVLSADRANRVLLVGNALSLVLTIVLDLALVGPFGAAGVALATVVTRTVATAYVVIACIRLALSPSTR